MVAFAELARAISGMASPIGPATKAADALELVDASVDSRRVTQGCLFCCVVGQQSDGHRFAGEAVARGARALLVSHELDISVPQLRVDESLMRRATAEAAALIHGNPSHEIPVVGITGTNGKTTTAAMIGAICEAAGLPSTVLGTLSGVRTTPESTDLQREMRRAVDAGHRIFIMEVTSHALALDRTHGTAFRAATFTNLGHDHLDFHGSVEAYFEAKAKLFEQGVADNRIVNRDDVHGAVLIERITATGGRVETYGIDDAQGLDASMSRSVFSWHGIDVILPIGGRHNVYNALAAATTAQVLGIPIPAIAAGLSRMDEVPGRMQRVKVEAPFSTFVDFAHTPDSLAAVLRSVRDASTPGSQVVVVFGCGGDRDPSKRPLMGRVASQLADLVIITTDNARSEDPNVIAGQILEGAQGGAVVRTILDRREAISASIEAARAGDVVVIAGKGHEKGQTIGGVTHDFDDMVEAARAMEMSVGGGQ